MRNHFKVKFRLYGKENGKKNFKLACQAGLCRVRIVSETYYVQKLVSIRPAESDLPEQNQAMLAKPQRLTCVLLDADLTMNGVVSRVLSGSSS